MEPQQWIAILGIIAGVMIPLVLALAPWMFMVHAKLAVLATKLDAMAATIVALCAQEDGRKCAEHTARLDAVEHRLENLERCE